MCKVAAKFRPSFWAWQIKTQTLFQRAQSSEKHSHHGNLIWWQPCLNTPVMTDGINIFLFFLHFIQWGATLLHILWQIPRNVENVSPQFWCRYMKQLLRPDQGPIILLRLIDITIKEWVRVSFHNNLKLLYFHSFDVIGIFSSVFSCRSLKFETDMSKSVCTDFIQFIHLMLHFITCNPKRCTLLCLCVYVFVCVLAKISHEHWTYFYDLSRK